MMVMIIIIKVKMMVMMTIMNDDAFTYNINYLQIYILLFVGWTLPSTWTWNDDGGINGGPRTYGWLTVRYRSNGNGCFPVISVRKFLRKRTLAGMKKIL